MPSMIELIPILGALMIGGLPFVLLLIIRSRQPAPWEIDDAADNLLTHLAAGDLTINQLNDKKARQ